MNGRPSFHLASTPYRPSLTVCPGYSRRNVRYRRSKVRSSDGRIVHLLSIHAASFAVAMGRLRRGSPGQARHQLTAPSPTAGGLVQTERFHESAGSTEVFYCGPLSRQGDWVNLRETGAYSPTRRRAGPLRGVDEIRSPLAYERLAEGAFGSPPTSAGETSREPHTLTALGSDRTGLKVLGNFRHSWKVLCHRAHGLVLPEP